MGDNRISELKHAHVKLSTGGEVMVLDTGAVIDAEAEAMLQALHSRSTGGLRSHLKILAEKGAENFMQNFYVGYGHKSIGDCGTTTVFVEGISMLAAKAMQDTQLYSGQEASTRFIPFSEQPFLNFTGRNLGDKILESQRDFYISAQEPTKKHLTDIYPQKEGEKDSVYQKAINARAFDITRSLLPAGAATNIAWHVNLRQAADRILFLRHHPLAEVREITRGLEEALTQKYPSSFSHKRYAETEAYQDLIAKNYYYHDHDSPLLPFVNFDNLDILELGKYSELFKKRPEKTELPKFLSQLGTIDAKFSLDFGSFRDIQRHRAIVQRMPLLTSDLGFNQWYVDNLPESIREKLPEHLGKILDETLKLGISPEEEQYFLPMGYNTANRFTGDLPAVVYMVELRDSRLVHPTLQRVAHYIGEKITQNLGIPLHVDSEPSRFDIKRGEHDIIIK